MIAPEVADIIRKSGMREYVPPPMWLTEEPYRKRREPVYTRTRDIGHYTVQMTRTDSTCVIKLYENLEGWRRKLRATWSGFDKPECDRKFEQVVEAVIQVRFEYKTKRIL